MSPIGQLAAVRPGLSSGVRRYLAVMDMPEHEEDGKANRSSPVSPVLASAANALSTHPTSRGLP